MSSPNWLSKLKRRKTETSEEVNKQKAANRAAWSSEPAIVFPKMPTANNLIVQQRLHNRLTRGNRTKYRNNWMTRRANPRMSPLNPRFTRANNKRGANGKSASASESASAVGNLSNANLYY